MAAVVSLFLSWRSVRTEPGVGRKLALIALRTVAALAVLALLAEPALRVVQTTRVRNRLAVLVDRSRSMNFPVEPGGESRVQAAARFVAGARPGLDALASEAAVEGWGFARDAWPADLAALAKPEPATGGATDVVGAIQAAAGGSGAPGRRLAGVLLVTDGADNGALSGGLAGQARADLLALGVPVNVVAVGSDAPRDLAIERVAVDDFAFVRNTLTVEATLKARGFGREDVKVLLKREGQVVAQANVKLEPGQESYVVPLSFAPDTTGTFVLTVSTPVLPGEAVVENNSRSFVLRVIRDRVRVLLVAGHPSWDERFLRGLLKQDPNVDLVSFFILRTAGDTPGPQDQLSLIPFPVAEIFGSQLRTFDAVLFVDFAYLPYRTLDIERYLPGLRDYVRGGGAFAMVGGNQSFAQGHYAGTPVADVLAVDPAEGLGMTAEPFRPRLTAEGRRHPITALVPGDAANEAAWAALPPLPGLNFTAPLPATEGARVLLEAPTLLSGGRPAPVVAVREVGAGRTLAVTTDGSWYWGFVAAGDGQGGRAHQRFWNAALRWLVRDPSLAPLQVQPERPSVEPGEPVAFSVAVRGPDYGPAPGAAVEGSLVAEDGRVVGKARAKAGADGSARLEFAAPPPGAYRLQAQAEVTGAAVEKGAAAVAVRASGAEDADAAPRPELLRQVAEATGGTFTRLPHSGLPELKLREPELVEVGRKRDEPLWNRWWALAALAGALTGEWLLRRRFGLW
ncbi:MAG TPA: glutamine amidotransferase [Anaeromyxobacteraceae bacterium]|nr:glutamine amidotransferase [Anaeromyxobacteraceae bacterium]